MNQHIISRVAIYILSIVLLLFGIQHFLHPYQLVTRLPEFLNGGLIWVYVTGAAFILAALSFMTNILVKVAAYLLAIMLFLFVITIHWPEYNNTADNEYQMKALTNLLKDAAIAAFALYIASNARHQRILEDVEEKEEKKEAVEV